MRKTRTRGEGWGKRKRNRRPSSDLTLGEVKKSPPQVPLFPGEKSSPASAVAPPPELSPATGEKRGGGREGKEGTGGEGPEKTRVCPSTDSGPLVHCGSQPATAFVSFRSLASPPRKGKAQVFLAGSSLFFSCHHNKKMNGEPWLNRSLS